MRSLRIHRGAMIRVTSRTPPVLVSRRLASIHVVWRSAIGWLVAGVEFGRTVVTRLATRVRAVPTLSLALVGGRRRAVALESVSVVKGIVSWRGGSVWIIIRRLPAIVAASIRIIRRRTPKVHGARQVAKRRLVAGWSVGACRHSTGVAARVRRRGWVTRVI